MTKRQTTRIAGASSFVVNNAFRYNTHSEVTSAAMGNNTCSYGYASIGNRVAATNNAEALAYFANALNQYTNLQSNSLQPVNLSYDSDGNLLTNGVWSYTWDAENRLICSEPGSVVTNGSVRVDNKYDHMNRRVQKIVRQLSGRGSGYPLDPSQPGMWNVIETRKYIWNNWNIAAEIVIDDPAGTTNINYNTWGLDLSGSLQGAGGVGGLLAVTKTSSSATNMFCAGADANGNITAYVDDGGTAVAQYAYSAFGETNAKSGSMADDFTHRFSTKPFEVETGYSKYQQRDYIPPLARWASRDPVEEAGGVPLYGFVDNDAINKYDRLGLCLSSDIIGGSLLLEYLQRLQMSAYGGIPLNLLFNKKNLPSLIVRNWPEVAHEQESMSDDTIRQLCAAGSGHHNLKVPGRVIFQSPMSVASFNESALFMDTSADVDNNCSYSADIKWTFYDEIDAKALKEWPEGSLQGVGLVGRIMVLYEALYDLLGDKLLKANFEVSSSWKTRVSGKCQ